MDDTVQPLVRHQGLSFRHSRNKIDNDSSRLASGSFNLLQSFPIIWRKKPGWISPGFLKKCVE
jgi:hypothetical protein